MPTEYVSVSLFTRTHTLQSNNMGSLVGHLVPGLMCILLSLWWFIGEILRRSQPNERSHVKQRSNFIQPAWYSCPGQRLSNRPVEPALKVAFALLGVIGELPLSNASALYDESGKFFPSHIDNYAHTVMYCFFGFTGVVDLVMWYNLLPLPPKFDCLIFSLAFWIEGFLFFFHLHGRDELNVRLHTILYVIIFVTAAAFLLAVIHDQFIPFLCLLKAYLLCLQGTWFSQIGFVLFGQHPWKNSPSNVEFLGIAFAVHVIALLAAHLIGHIICYQCFIKKREQREGLLDDTSTEETVFMLYEQP